MEQKTIACLASYFKGYDFMDEMKTLGHRVILITSENIRDRKWPWHAIDEVYYMPEVYPSLWNLEDLVAGFAYLLETRKIDAVIALDDYDVEKAAMLRETFRIAGMGQTTQRYFRDKLAMRQKAAESEVLAPAFTAVFNNEDINDFAAAHPFPCVLKPRSEASALGIQKINSIEELWINIDKLGPQRYLYLLESFKPGDVFHVDSLVYQNEVVFTSASKYLAPPMQISQGGGVFRTMTLEKKSDEFIALESLNKKILKNFGLKNGASHTEFIRCREDGEWYFLETSARVGGAHIAELIEASTSINIWREWAKIEDALLTGKIFKLSKPEECSAGLLISLIKTEIPDNTAFNAEDIYKYLEIPYHVGLIYKADSTTVVRKRLDEASEIITNDMLGILPPKEKPIA